MGNAFTLLLIFGAAVTGVFLLFRHPLLYLFGASDATYPYAEAYMTIYLLGTVFVMIGLGMNPFITSQGFGRTGMMTVGLGAVVNIVLDPVFIFALDMGVRRWESLASYDHQRRSGAGEHRPEPGVHFW